VRLSSQARFGASSLVAGISAHMEWATITGHCLSFRGTHCRRYPHADFSCCGPRSQRGCAVRSRFTMRGCDSAGARGSSPHKVDFLDASDVMNLVSDFAGCTAQTQQKALETRAELGKLREQEYARSSKNQNGKQKRMYESNETASRCWILSRRKR